MDIGKEDEAPVEFPIPVDPAKRQAPIQEPIPVTEPLQVPEPAHAMAVSVTEQEEYMRCGRG